MALTTPVPSPTGATGQATRTSPLRTLAHRLATRDPGGAATTRSVRAAVVMPSVLAIATALTTNAQLSLFAAFGAFSLMLMAEFSGSPRARRRGYLGLFGVGVVFITAGTLCSSHPVAAVLVMAVVGFAVIFAGVMSPAAVTGGTAALLTFVLADAVAQPPSAIPARLAGWALAGALAVPACLWIWPPPWQDNLRRRIAEASGSLAVLYRELSRPEFEPQGGVGPQDGTAATATGPGPQVGTAATTAARDDVAARLHELGRQFDSTPYPPGGTCAGDLSIAKLVARLQWVGSLPSGVVDPAAPASERTAVYAVFSAAADVFDAMAALFGSATGDPASAASLTRGLAAVNHARLDALDASVRHQLEQPPDGDGPAGEDWLRGVDATLAARMLAAAAELTGEEALVASPVRTGDAGGWWARTSQRWRRRWRTLCAVVGAHHNARSVWFRNSVRGGVGLALAVAVVEITAVNHGFWVVLGAMSVLRSNAQGTGATALRAIVGTLVGFVVGALILIGLGDHTVLLWVLLPVAVLVAGLAPAVSSFAAGQAGFTVTVVILFNILVPTGWRVGLVRVEDVAIGCAVALVTGVLFWPRGAADALGRALCESYAAAADYLVVAVTRLTESGPDDRTEAAYRFLTLNFRRLDDCFRQYLSERGAKRVPLPVVTAMVNGVPEVGLSAHAMATVPALPAGTGTEMGEVAAAGAALRQAATEAARWYEGLAASLRGDAGQPPAVPGAGEPARPPLERGLAAARAAQRPLQVRMMLRMIWAEEHLRFQRSLQLDLATRSPSFARGRGRWWA